MTVKKIAIISLSRGLLGEPFIKHEEELGFRRLRSYGIEVVTTANACKGIAFLQSHPEDRAQDSVRNRWRGHIQAAAVFI